jgi:hypothetical protein
LAEQGTRQQRQAEQTAAAAAREEAASQRTQQAEDALAQVKDEPLFSHFFFDNGDAHRVVSNRLRVNEPKCMSRRVRQHLNLACCPFGASKTRSFIWPCRCVCVWCFGSPLKVLAVLGCASLTAVAGVRDELEARRAAATRLEAQTQSLQRRLDEAAAQVRA